MKNCLLSLIVLMLPAQGIFAQNVSLKGDTIFNGKIPYALFKKNQSRTAQYAIYSLDGKHLIELHYSYLNNHNNADYVVTFMNDHRQAMITKRPGFPTAFIKDVVKSNLIDHGTVNQQSEAQYVSRHRLPLGYTDMAEIIDY